MTAHVKKISAYSSLFLICSLKNMARPLSLELYEQNFFHEDLVMLQCCVCHQNLGFLACGKSVVEEVLQICLQKILVCLPASRLG